MPSGEPLLGLWPGVEDALRWPRMASRGSSASRPPAEHRDGARGGLPLRGRAPVGLSRRDAARRPRPAAGAERLLPGHAAALAEKRPRQAIDGVVRKETASAVAKAAEVRTELAASKLELVEELKVAS